MVVEGPDVGFWGPITASTEWCESNYVITKYIAEYWNTLSNAACVLLAFFGLWNSVRQRFEKRFAVLYSIIAVIGVGSALFHATLRHVQQQSDETPMVWAMLVYLYVLYSPVWHYTKAMPMFLFIYGALFAVVHSQFRFVLGFQLHYAFLILLCLPRMYKYYLSCDLEEARHIAQLYIHTLLVGSACWIADRNFCSALQALPINPQGHAWWHILMGLNSYYGCTFLQYCRAKQLNWAPKIRHWLGLPYVVVSKPPTAKLHLSSNTLDQTKDAVKID